MNRSRLAGLPLFFCTTFLLQPGVAQLNYDASTTDPEGEPVIIREQWERPTRVELAIQAIETESLFSNFATTNNDPEGDLPRDLDITPDGTKIFIANRDTDTVSVFEVATQSITDTVSVGDFPVDVEITPDGQFAVVPNVFSHTVSVIDVEDLTVVEVPITGEQPYTVRITDDSAFAIVGVINDAIDSALAVIRLSDMVEVESIPTISQGVIGGFSTPESGISGLNYTQFELSPNLITVILPDRVGDQVALYDLLGGPETLLPTADAPTSVAISQDGTFAVLGHQGSDSVLSVLDLNNFVISNELPTNDVLRNQIIRITPDQRFAVGSLLNEVVFVNLLTGANTVISTGTPGDIEFSFDDQYAFVSNFNARVIDLSSLSLVDTIAAAACADAVTSPTELRAFALNNRFREDIHTYNINGSAGFFEGRVLTGEIEEGDATRTLALTPDGLKIVAANLTSNNVSIMNACTGEIEAYVPTGERSWGVAVTPDGTTAVVCSLEDNRVSIIDVANGTNLVDLNVAQRPTEVAISPDSQMAFVTSIQGTDRVHFIQLDGANSTVVGSIVAGQMGTVIHTFNVASGISVSPDGSVVGVCISFDDELLLIDAGTLSEIARVPVGDFPIRVTFSTDSQTAYVSNRFDDSVSVVDINGGSSQQIDVVNGIAAPLDVALDDANSFGFVGNFDFGSPSIKVFDTASGNVVNTVPVGDSPRRLILDDATGQLIVATTEGELLTYDVNGSNLTLTDAELMTSSPSDMAYSSHSRVTAVALPIPDGVELVSDVLRGDVNLDGVIDLLDVTPFVAVLTGGSFQIEADINKDGLTDLLDVTPFVELLTGG